VFSPAEILASQLGKDRARATNHALAAPRGALSSASRGEDRRGRMQLTLVRGSTMAGQGSGGNVLAAICSFFIPGLGQLVQGRVLAAAIQFVLAGVLWLILMGWVVHLYSIYDAAVWVPPSTSI
jgi:TM2 domain-containing membrane protein YozV